jgi:hypothetical protein
MYPQKGWKMKLVKVAEDARVKISDFITLATQCDLDDYSLSPNSFDSSGDISCTYNLIMSAYVTFGGGVISRDVLSRKLCGFEALGARISRSCLATTSLK